jgi:hypothetical protein
METITNQIIAAFATLSADQASEMLKTLNAKYKPVAKATTGNNNPACSFKVGDKVVVKEGATSVSKKWIGKVLTVTNVGDIKLYLDNPEFPGVKNKSVWPLFSEVELAPVVEEAPTV